MTKLEQIEKTVSELDPKELEAFSAWFEEFQSARWDRQLEKDAASGKPDFGRHTTGCRVRFKHSQMAISRF